MKDKFAVFTAIFLVFSGCSTVNRVPQSLASSNEELQAAFTEEMSHHIGTMKRDVKVYHYGERGPGLLDAKRAGTYESPLELEPKEAKAYFRKYSSGFIKDAPSDLAVVGSGVYAATDAVGSEFFAGKPWFLMEIPVPAGTKYLRLAQGNRLYFSKAFIDRWFPGPTLGKLANDPDRHADTLWVPFKQLLGWPKLRELLNASLKELGVDFIAYPWVMNSYSICDEFGVSVAFDFIDPSFLERTSSPRVFVSEIEDAPSPEKKSAYLAIYRKIANARFYFLTEAVKEDARGLSYSGDWNTQARIRILTRPWSDYFKLPYVMDRLFAEPAKGRALYANLYGLDRHSEVHADYPFDLKAFNVLRSGGDLSEVQFDPLSNRSSPIGGDKDSIAEEIVRDTFGCSSANPEEKIDY